MIRTQINTMHRHTHTRTQTQFSTHKPNSYTQTHSHKTNIATWGCKQDFDIFLSLLLMTYFETHCFFNVKIYIFVLFLVFEDFILSMLFFFLICVCDLKCKVPK